LELGEKREGGRNGVSDSQHFQTRVSNMTVYASILQEIGERESIRTNRTAESIKILKSRLVDSINSLTRLRKTADSFYRKFAQKYRKSVGPARNLQKDFHISQTNLLIPSNSVYKREPLNSIKVYASPDGLSILCRNDNGENDEKTEWKSCGGAEARLRQSILDFVLGEVDDHIAVAHTVVKGSLNRISQVKQMQNTSGGDHKCLELEMQKLSRLFKFRQLSLPRPSTATILFFLMRIDNRMQKLKSVLCTCYKFLKVTQNQLLTKPGMLYSLSKAEPIHIEIQSYKNLKNHGTNAPEFYPLRRESLKSELLLKTDAYSIAFIPVPETPIEELHRGVGLSEQLIHSDRKCRICIGAEKNG